MTKKIALVLSGGGARAAYQVGVLKAIAQILPRGAHNPFAIICGTSAGAINSAALATHGGNYRSGVRGLDYVWSHLTSEQIYETDYFRSLRTTGRWLNNMLFRQELELEEPALLDTQPLRELLSRIIRFDRIQRAIDRQDLQALCISASSYTSARSIYFFQGLADIPNWHRAKAWGIRTRLNLDHILASAAIPLVFPSVRIENEYFGDGAIGQVSPLSPAIQMGADRVLVVGVARSDSRQALEIDPEKVQSPGFAEISGHLFERAFLDTLEGDMERVTQINRMLELVPMPQAEKESLLGLRHVDVINLTPSVPLDSLAIHHLEALPRSLRFFLQRNQEEGEAASLLSFLLFEGVYCQELIRQGFDDAMAIEARLNEFLLGP